MTADLLHETVERLAPLLPELDRRLRGPSLESVARRVITLNDGEVHDPSALTVALIRAASLVERSWARAKELSVRASGHLASGAMQDFETSLPQLEFPGRAAPKNPEPEARLEALRVYMANLVDELLVALALAPPLLSGLPSPHLRAGRLDNDSLLEVSVALAGPHLPPLVRERAWLVVKALVERLPETERALTLGIGRLREVQDAARSNPAPFVQEAAQRVYAILGLPDAEHFWLDILRDRTGGDAFLGRAATIDAIASSRFDEAFKMRCLVTATTDPSEHVAQRLCVALSTLRDRAAGALLLQVSKEHTSPRVRGFAILRLTERLHYTALGAASTLEALQHASEDASAIVQECALHCALQSAAHGHHSMDPLDLAQLLSRMIQTRDVPMAERAALTLRTVHLAYDAETRELHERVQQLRRQTRALRKARLKLDPRVPELVVERALVAAAAEDLCWGITRRRRELSIVPGETPRFSFWRSFHELTHPAPDKRQGYRHSATRRAAGTIHTVPIGMAEVTMTRVPGQRVATLGQSWGGFLPRPEDLLSACRSPRGLRLLGVFGTLTITARAGPLKRWWLGVVVALRYAALARLRHQSLSSPHAAVQYRYVRRLRELGFSLEWVDCYVSFGASRVDLFPARLKTYFSPPESRPVAADATSSTASLLIPFFGGWTESILQYVLAPSGNTAWHLAIVVWLLVTSLVVRAAWVLRRFELAKKRIPLSIGGWGSRGKSGSERLKAALFHAQHYDVVSKTTGCEAMLIVARRGQPAEELFLYRPYDKATIWEQETVVEYAERLHAQVFLWECMALQPAFVDILNREWMKDSLTTITNAYPDHEDIMGPSGVDVAETIAQFIPNGGSVFTSEEQMLPVLRESAASKASDLVPISSLEAALLPSDLVSRYPYDEHPKNLALIVRLAERLGVDRTRALVDMADYVVPDLGVLKTFPWVTHARRRLQFVNGMSANERAGFLSNWTRLGFDVHNPDETPELMVVAVVNNRADRIPRSEVFANLLVNDVCFDRIVVIGTNQRGMQRFLETAIRRQASALEITTNSSAQAAVDQVFSELLRIPKHDATILARLRLVVGSPDTAAQAEPEQHAHQWQVVSRALQLVNSPDIDEDRLQQACSSLEESLAQLCTEGVDDRVGSAMDVLEPFVARRKAFIRVRQCLARGELDAAADTLRHAYSSIMHKRILVLEDSDATGDQVVDFVARSIPGGLSARLLGCQNIKGTGLDFVYRFIALERVQRWLTELERDPASREQVLTQLQAFSDWGVLGCSLALEYFASVRGQAAWLPQRDAVDLLARSLEQQQRMLLARLATRGRPQLGARLLSLIEPLVDHLDSIRRRRRANRLMAEAISGHLSHSEAARRLREVVARQKGGWLKKDLSAIWQRMTRRRRPTQPASPTPASKPVNGSGS